MQKEDNNVYIMLTSEILESFIGILFSYYAKPITV